MSLKMKWISAALALGAVMACMKAGDGVGLDSSGRVCTSESKDSACIAFLDPCKLNPSAAGCQIDSCAINPALAGCKVPCATNPSAQICIDSCAINPALAYCAVKVSCATTPTAQICLDSCKTNPALSYCKVDCSVTPTDPSCPAPKTKFSEVYTIITGSTCLQCHSPGQVGVTTGKLDMSSSDGAYANLVGVLVADQALAPGWVRVLPGKPDSSMLYLKVAAAPTGFQPKLPNGTAYHDAMPLTGAPLTKAKLDLIKKWITDGAVK
jgi:hypothetical protein